MGFQEHYGENIYQALGRDSTDNQASLVKEQDLNFRLSSLNYCLFDFQ